MCKIESEPALPGRCLALDLVAAERSEHATVHPCLYLRMEVAAPNVVLFALPHLVGEAVITSVVRMDLATPAAAEPQ